MTEKERWELAMQRIDVAIAEIIGTSNLPLYLFNERGLRFRPEISKEEKEYFLRTVELCNNCLTWSYVKDFDYSRVLCAACAKLDEQLRRDNR